MAADASYIEFPPVPLLRPFIKCFWRAAAGRAGVREQLVLPDGSVDLIFSFEKNRPAGLRAVGAMTRPLLSRMRPGHSLLGVRFEPGGAYPFIGLPLHELSDRIIPVSDLGGDLASLESPEARNGPEFLAQLQEVMLRRARGGPGIEPRIARAAALIGGDFPRPTGRITIAALSAELNLSRQHLKRLFDKHTGLGPARFIRIARLQALLGELNGHPGERRPKQSESDKYEPDWADLAVRFGYYDQAHLINDFRELTGRTPGFHFSNTRT